MNSLRVRLLVVTVLVAAVAVGASAWFSRQVVNHEFQRFVVAPEPAAFDRVAKSLDAAWRARASLSGADADLARVAPELGRALILADTTGVVIAASDPPFRGALVTWGSGGRMTLEGRSRTGSRLAGLMLELVDPPSFEMRWNGGSRIGTLYALPEPRAPRPEDRPFLRSVHRGMWVGALGAIALGGLLVWLLSSRIVGPIEALTEAARHMERGDLSRRVAPRGHDEVATLGRRFNAMAESLGRTQQLRRQLAHDIAHELRTPLTNLRAQIEALQDGLLEPDAGSLASLHGEVMLLARLVEDLGQLSALEAGALELELARVPVIDALEGAAAAFRAQAAGREIALNVNAEPGLTVRADPARLGQILRNLLGNALIHTPSGGRISLAARRAGEHTAIEVEDTGSGIAAEHLPHVFDRFYRADPSRSRATGGAGLGLAIVQHLVSAQGGEVRARSERDRGTTIHFTLPNA